MSRAAEGGASGGLRPWVLLVGAAGPMSGLALFVIPIDITDPALRPYYAVEAGLMILAWLGARIVLRR